ncbi:D-sedoheptulose 7-phosphate isomerase [Candidatus Woesearchaeota archaeon]|nr:D-sedoheptulose 7-phosphate isomerase [Candidatus Woesearchaeota archaeon]
MKHDVFIKEELDSSRKVKGELAQDEGFIKKSAEAGDILIQALKDGKKVLVCGNGGSAADAQHFAGELVVRFEKERRKLPGLALTTDTSILTACGNDYGYDNVFKLQVEAYGAEGDVLVGISTSGNSENVLRAAEAAKEKGMNIILLLGKDGGKLKEYGHAVVVPSQETKRIQEVHITLIHTWCGMIDEAFTQ